MSAETITIRRELLSHFTSAVAKGIVIALIERADRYGQVKLSVRSFAKELGVGRQVVRDLITYMVKTHLITQRITQATTQPITHRDTLITFCNKASYTASKKEQKPNPQPTFQPKQQPTQQPIKLDVDADFKKVWQMWLDYKAERKSKYKSERSAKTGYKKLYELSSGNAELAEKIVEQSIAFSWSGLFPLRDTNNNGKTQSQYTARRGTAAESHTESDYNGTF